MTNINTEIISTFFSKAECFDTKFVKLGEKLYVSMKVDFKLLYIISCQGTQY